MAPQWRQVGSVASGTGAISPGLPSGTIAGDLLVMFCENSAEADTTASGWTKLDSQTQTGVRLTILWKIAAGGDATTTNDVGNHQMARIIGFIAGTFDASNPFSTGTLVKGVEAAGTSKTIGGMTTTVPNAWVIAAIAGDLPDATSTAEWASWANANLTNTGERIDNSHTAGNGGSLGVWMGEMVTAGAVGNVTVTAASSRTTAHMMFAILPQLPPSAVVLNTPADGATAQSVTPTLNFTGTDPNSNSVEYQLQIATDSSFTSVDNAYYFDASDAGATDPNANWLNESNAFDSNTTTVASDGAIVPSSVSNGYLMGEGTNAPGSGTDSDILEVQVRIKANDSDDDGTATRMNAAVYSNGLAELLGTVSMGTGLVSAYSAYSTITPPTGGWTWAAIAALEVKFYRTGGGLKQLYIAIAEINVVTKNSVVVNKFSVFDTGFTSGHPFTSGAAKDFTVQAGDTLLGGTTYYWRVRAIDPSGSNTYGSWSSTRSFTTVSAGGQPTIKRHSTIPFLGGSLRQRNF